MAWLDAVLITLSALLCIPGGLLLLQVLASLLPAKLQGLQGARPGLAVLVPAHNESQGIATTLLSVQSQLQAGDRLVVVADNCSDDTAAIARALGAEVIERHHDTLRGKGYALDFGVRYLEAAPPEVVVIVDADCVLGEQALAHLALQAHRLQQPAQALDLMLAPKSAGLKLKVAEFAWLFKNQVRAMGFMKLGLPCQLMGTGMAFPWVLIQSTTLASGHLVEDLKLGLDLARQGCAPAFCPHAVVTSYFPESSEGAKTQRTRWEHGHLGVILNDGLPAFWQAVMSGKLSLLAMVVDMMVPPLALLVVLLLAWLGVCLLWALLVGGFYSAWLACAAFCMVLFAVLLAWALYARHVISALELAYIPIYVLAKIPTYVLFLFKRQVGWVRSSRDSK